MRSMATARIQQRPPTQQILQAVIIWKAELPIRRGGSVSESDLKSEALAEKLGADYWVYFQIRSGYAKSYGRKSSGADPVTDVCGR